MIEILKLWGINLFRQASYIINSKKKDPTEFIDADESRKFHKERKYLLEYFKELVLSIFFVMLAIYFNFPWLLFGIAFDAIQDIFIAFFGNFYRKISKNLRVRQFLREFLVPYGILATIFYLIKFPWTLFVNVAFLITAFEFLLFLAISEQFF